MSYRKRRSAWTENDEQMLIEKWAKRANDLRQAKRNAHIYHDMSMDMKGKFTAEEVHVKVKNLTKKYRDEKIKLDARGGGASWWKHYSAVHRIVDSKSVNDGPIIVESFSLNTASNKRSSSPSIQPQTPPSPSPSSSSALDPLTPLLPPSPLSPPAGAQAESSSSSSSAAAASPLPPLSPAAPKSRLSLDTSVNESRDHYDEIEQILKQQTEVLKAVVDDTRLMTGEIVNAIKENNSSSEKLVCLMEKLIEKI